ncbi:MAG: hypothetical protein KDI61_04350 [Alphaproteobacteria bacterium]|nr:hypothetical protein [Alphaproteobacteria bacterium]MCB1839479.1 hypothetical protein [Alphaproteobacteria bacterium]
MEGIESYRVCVYVPLDSLEEFIRNVSPEIPSFLGNYDHVCWWTEKGIEQSRKIGSKQIERVPCARFECSLPKDRERLRRFIENTVKPSHPWEEPVILIHESIIMKNNM